MSVSCISFHAMACFAFHVEVSTTEEKARARRVRGEVGQVSLLSCSLERGGRARESEERR